MATSTHKYNFLGLPDSLTDPDTAKVAIMALPYEATTTYGKGTKHGPEAILAASQQLEFFDEELKLEACEIGMATHAPFESFPERPEQAVGQVARECEQLLSKNKFVVGLGGEHTVSIGMVKAFQKHFPNLWVLQLDAHSDMRNAYLDSPFNHACVMARIGEICPFIGMGIRSAIKGEKELVKSPSRIFYAHELVGNHTWTETVLAKLGDPVYVTIDLDFFDPSIVPSVGTPEPGGFGWYETLSFLRKVALSRKVVGFDVVELCPKAGFPASDFLAAKLIYKFLGYIFEDRLRTGSA